MSKKSASGGHNAVALKVNCNAAVLILIYAVLAAAFAYHHQSGFLVLSSAKTGEVYARYPVHTSDTFSIGFIHSVNKSPVTDYYEIRPDAGVQTELEEGQKLEYGDDGSMIITGFDRKMNDLVYFVGTVSDHTLTLEDGEEISLRDLCGRNAKVRFALEW